MQIDKILREFDSWFDQFTRPYEEFEKNKEKLWEMLGVIGEKEAPMDVVARLEEIKRLRKMQFLFKKFLSPLLHQLETEVCEEAVQRVEDQARKSRKIFSYREGSDDYRKGFDRGIKQATGIILDEISQSKETNAK